MLQAPAAFAVLATISFCPLLNDMMQALLSAIGHYTDHRPKPYSLMIG